MCILKVVLIDTHFFLLLTFIISALTGKKYKKFWKYKFLKIVLTIAIILCENPGMIM